MGCVLSCSCARSEQDSPRKLEIGNPTSPSTTVDINMLNLQPIQNEDANASSPTLIKPMQHSLDLELLNAAAKYAEENRSRGAVRTTPSKEDSILPLVDETGATVNVPTTPSPSASVTAVGNGTSTSNGKDKAIDDDNFSTDTDSIRPIRHSHDDKDNDMEAFPDFYMSEDITDAAGPSRPPRPSDNFF